MVIRAGGSVTVKRWIMVGPRFGRRGINRGIAGSYRRVLVGRRALVGQRFVGRETGGGSAGTCRNIVLQRGPNDGGDF